MFHLLTRNSIFVALPNECLCQIAGPVITDMKPTSTFIGMPVEEPASVAGTKREAPATDARPRKRPRVEATTSAMKPRHTTATACVVCCHALGGAHCRLAQT